LRPFDQFSHTLTGFEMVPLEKRLAAGGQPHQRTLGQIDGAILRALPQDLVLCLKRIPLDQQPLVPVHRGGVGAALARVALKGARTDQREDIARLPPAAVGQDEDSAFAAADTAANQATDEAQQLSVRPHA
jgi:hypothetical protein